MGAALAVEYARSIRSPSLVLHGDADAITPVQRGIELARLTSAELVVYPVVAMSRSAVTRDRPTA
jgi:pimeloyl-ACP methyl ester carboxylesterase